jgi:hypothetical protein
MHITNEFGHFSELEYHVPAIGRGTGRSRCEDISLGGHFLAPRGRCTLLRESYSPSRSEDLRGEAPTIEQASRASRTLLRLRQPSAKRHGGTPIRRMRRLADGNGNNPASIDPGWYRVLVCIDENKGGAFASIIEASVATLFFQILWR